MRILDLFSGAGAAGMGYYRAGFEVVGVDIEDRPTYPFEFWRMDALDLDYEKLDLFDVIHASPPCQQYSRSTALARRRGKTYPDLYQPVKAMLVAAGKPYVIENVMGSPVRGIGLCGTMFGLGVFRHRVFESNIPLQLPEQRCVCSQRRIGKGYVTVAGDSCTKLEALGAMGIHWRMSKDEVTQAIPPAFTEFIGRQIYEKLQLINDENPVLMRVQA